MLKYTKVINKETGLCEVGTGTNSQFYTSIGMKKKDVQQSDVDGQWYLAEKCPMKTEAEKLNIAKAAKYNEINNGARIYLESGNALFELVLEANNDLSPQPSPQGEGEKLYKSYHIEATDGNIAKLSAYALSFLSGAFPQSEVYWNTKEDETIALNQEQLTQALQGLGEVQATVWNVKFPYYLKQIEEAKTVDEVNAIVVDYSQDIPAEDENPTDSIK